VGWIEDRPQKDGTRRFLAVTRGPDRKKISRSFTRKLDARRWLAETESEVHRGAYIDPRGGRILLGEAMEHWLSTRVGVRDTTRVRDESLLRNHVLPEFENFPIDALSREATQRWVATLSETLAPQTVRRAHQLLSGILDEAVAAGRLRANPVRGLALPRVEKTRQRYLTPSEIAKLAEAIEPRYKPLVLVLAWGGLRIGEAAALRHKDIDRRRETISIEATLVEVHGSLVEHEPKTVAGRRRVTVPSFVLDAIPEGDPEAFVFAGPGGGGLRARQFSKRFFHPAVARAGLEPLTVHDLRRTYITLLFHAGASPVEVSKRVGHADTRTAMEVYASVMQETEQRTTEALAALAE
jgi:integrase